METEKLLEFAVQTAKTAGQRLAKIHERRVNSDFGNDVKLQEDVESEMFIRDLLSTTKIPVIGEEQGGDDSLTKKNELYWVVDPIDGTYNYLRGIPGVCVSIALMQGMTPIVGVIYDFTRDEIFYAGKGTPLYLNGKIVKPNWAKETSQAVIMTGFPSRTDYSDESLKSFVTKVQKFKKVRMCGSAALAIAYVAAGRADIYSESKVYLWDIAGGLALIESAGGLYKVESANISGYPLCLNIQAAAKKEFFV